MVVELKNDRSKRSLFLGSMVIIASYNKILYKLAIGLMVKVDPCELM